MPAVPRIRRATPKGIPTRPEKPIPVIARIRWNHGVDQDVPATAIAWTSEAVEIEWEMETGEGHRTDWVSANDIRRPGEPAPAEDPEPPHTRAGQPRGRW